MDNSKLDNLGPFYQNIKLEGEFSVKGWQPTETKWKCIKNLIPEDLEGLSVLDVGCNAGFFSIQMKNRGAKHVVGIDVNERFLRQARQLQKITKLDIQYRKMSVYELNKNFGEFDIVLFLGVIYHCKYPLLALEKLFQVTGNLIIVESEISPEITHKSKMELIKHRYKGDDFTNWWIFDRECILDMMETAGFKDSKLIQTYDYGKIKSKRGIFIGRKFTNPNEIVINAGDFDEGNLNPISNEFGEGLVIDGGITPSFAKYNIYFPFNGEYELWVKYASFSYRPVDIYFDKKLICKEALKELTKGWTANNTMWFKQTKIVVLAGFHELSFFCKNVSPHIEKIKFIKLMKSSADNLSEIDKRKLTLWKFVENIINSSSNFV